MPNLVGSVRTTLFARAFENVVDLNVDNVRNLFPQPAARLTASTNGAFLTAYTDALRAAILAQNESLLNARVAAALQLTAEDALPTSALFTERTIGAFARALLSATNEAERPEPPTAPVLHVGDAPAFALALEEGEFICLSATVITVRERTLPLTLRMIQRASSDDVRSAPLPLAHGYAGVAPTDAKELLHQLVQLLFRAIVDSNNNKPTVTALFFHLYFTALYNVKLLVATDAAQSVVPHGAEQTAPVPADFATVRADIQRLLRSQADFADTLLAQLLFVAHQSFCSARFGAAYAAQASLTLRDLSAREYVLPAAWTALVSSWASALAHALDAVLPNALLGPVLPFHVRADVTGADNGVNSNPLHWQPLQIPTGVVRNADGVPVVDAANPASFSKQRFLGATWGQVRGFAVDPAVGDVLALHDRIATTWEDASKETDLKRETDAVLEVYASLGDREQAIAELFAGSGPRQLPPPAFMLTIALGLSRKHRQSVWGDVDLLFALGAAVYDASIAAWYYKATFMQARPITLIRHFYKERAIRSWAPGRGVVDMTGAQWLPFQTLNFVVPPFPDVMSGHSTFSAAAGGVLRWWFNSDVLYDGYSVVPVADCSLIANNLSMAIKTQTLGEYVVEPGNSDVEPGVAPARAQVLRYATISALVADAGYSRIYGGIHIPQTNTLSLLLGNDVAERVQRAVTDRGVKSPFHAAL
jgi:hypothetical protein